MQPDSNSFVRIEMNESDYLILKDSGVFDGITHELKEVKIKDDFFKDDPVYKALRKAARKTYTEMQEYEYKKRNNIP